MPILSSTLSELDWATPEQQEAVLQVMNFYGCFSDSLPNELLTSAEIEVLKAREMTVDDVNAAMQAKLKRPADAERAMLGLDTRFSSNEVLRSEVIARYNTLGMIQEIKPPEGVVYDAILLLGSSQPNFTLRLGSLIRFENDRHISGPIYLLGSDRELWPIHESIMTTLLAARAGMTEKDLNDYFIAKFTAGGETLETVRTKPAILNRVRAEIYAEFRGRGVAIPTEAEMMYAVVEQSALKDTPHIKIEAGKRPDDSRANTEDTAVKFDEYYRTSNPGKSGIRVLVISTQPEALYQIEPIRKVLTPEKGYSIIDIGAEAAKGTVNPLVINDSIARKVYSRREQMQARTTGAAEASIAPDGSVASSTDRSSSFVDKLNAECVAAAKEGSGRPFP